VVGVMGGGHSRLPPFLRPGDSPFIILHLER
jgi:hypothetical protein